MNELEKIKTIERVELLSRIITEHIHLQENDKDIIMFWFRDLLEPLKKQITLNILITQIINNHFRIVENSVDHLTTIINYPPIPYKPIIKNYNLRKLYFVYSDTAILLNICRLLLIKFILAMTIYMN